MTDALSLVASFIVGAAFAALFIHIIILLCEEVMRLWKEMSR